MYRLRPLSLPVVAGIVLLALCVGRPTTATGQAPGDPTEAYARVATWSSGDQPPPPDAFREPRGAAVDPFDGTVYLVDGGNNRVQVFQPDGSFVRTLGAGPAPAALDDPQGVALQGSLVFVTDRGHDRVAVFTVDGDYLSEWSGLAGPWGIAAAADGRVFVVENEANRVAVFRADGRRLATWGGAVGGAFALVRPRGVAALADGRVVVADYGNDRLIALDKDGLPQDESARQPGPLDLAFDPSGSLYAVYDGGQLRRHDVTNGLPLDARTWPVPGAAGVAVSTAGAVFVTFQDDTRPLHGVQRFTGRPLVADTVWGGVPAPLGRLDAPFRVAADGATTLVTDSWRRVQRYDAAGLPTSQTPVGAANDVTAGPDGGVHVVRDGEVLRLAADGQVTWRYVLPAAAGDYAWGVALDWNEAQDRLAVLDLGGQQVRLLNGTGQPSGSWSFRPAPGTFALLWDLAPAPGGYYVVNRKADTLERRSPAGVVEASWSVAGGPLRVASDAAGNAFVLNRSGWVWKYTPAGVLRAVWQVSLDPESSQPADLTVTSDGRVIVADARLDELAVFALDPNGNPGSVPRFEPTCRATGAKTADPTQLYLGEETTIRLQVGGGCPAVESLADIVLVIDHSGSMGPMGKLDAAKVAAKAFLDATDFAAARVAVVGFNQDALLLTPLTSNKVNAAVTVDALVAGGGTDIAAGMDAARRELTGPRRRLTASGVVILMTDGGSNAVAAQRAADQTKLEGLRVFTIGYGPDAATVLLQSLASSPSDYYFAPDAASLVTVYQALARRVAAKVLFATLTVTDVLPDNMAFVAGSGLPAPIVNGQTLVWQLADVPLAGVELAYRVRPLEVGLWPTNVVAAGEGTDGLGQRGQVGFPVPVVTVLAPTGTPPASATYTATPPPTQTPRPTDTPSATPTATPGATRPPMRARAYLPIALNGTCLSRKQHADVVLIVDTSESMSDPVPGGGTKLDAALAAARDFVDLLDLDDDAAAVVTFNGESSLRLGLSQDRTALLAALAGLPQAAGTRIDLGLRRAAEAFAGPGRHPLNAPVAILLTDGRPSGATDAQVMAAGDALKGAKVSLYAVGLGADVDAGLLARLASDPQHLVLAPDAAQLARIYADIARELPCLGH
jgi:Mg-chelatase subunit ChlD/DNA-binding beta-propeller fold protein YncE